MEKAVVTVAEKLIPESLSLFFNKNIQGEIIRTLLCPEGSNFN